MATNKNAITRYIALDKCFRNPGIRFDISKLVDECNEALLSLNPDASGVEKRQVYYDINFMKDPKGYNAPIITFRDGKNVYYRYSDIHFSINNQPLNGQEAQLLNESLMTLSRFKGLPQFEWLEELRTRLEQSFKLNSEEEVIGFDKNPYLQGIEHLTTLYNAIINKQTLAITYQPFQKDQQIIEISPWYLKQYNNRWYLLAPDHNNHDSEHPYTYPLDRIVAINESKAEYRPNTQIDFNEYFEDVVGITVYKDKEVETIKLKVDKKLWPYIETKPLHGSQSVLERNDNHIIIKLKVIPNYELESVLFSRGESIEILEPAHLRTSFAKRVEVLAEKYRK